MRRLARVHPLGVAYSTDPGLPECVSVELQVIEPTERAAEHIAVALHRSLPCGAIDVEPLKNRRFSIIDETALV